MKSTKKYQKVLIFKKSREKIIWSCAELRRKFTDINIELEEENKHEEVFVFVEKSEHLLLQRFVLFLQELDPDILISYGGADKEGGTCGLDFLTKRLELLGFSNLHQGLARVLPELSKFKFNKEILFLK